MSREDEERYANIMREVLSDQNKAIMELLTDVQRNVAYIPAMRDDIAQLKADMTVVKAVLTDHSHELHELERRVDRLEAA